MNNRRRFLRTTLYSAVSTLFIPRMLRAGDPSGGACTITTADVEGPFFTSGAPFRVKLAVDEEPGTRLFISGRVLARDCTPILGATVDIWAANDDGCYGWFNNCSGTPGEDRYNLRGRMLTNAEGAYSYETVKPGSYDNRPSHIHYRITAPTGEALITQLYFEGDPLIPTDPFATRPGTGPRIIPLTTDAAGLHGMLDIILNVDNTTSAVEGDTTEAAGDGFDLAECRPNPFAESTVAEYSLDAPAQVDIAVYSVLGGRVRTLGAGMVQGGRHQLRWDGRDDGGRMTPAGTYLIWSQAGERIRTVRVVRR